MMVSQQLDHVVNVYGFISTSISPITNKLYRMVNQKTLILSFKNDEITTTSSRCWHLWLFIKRYKTYRNQTSYEKKPPCTDLTLQLLIPINHMTSVYGFIFTVVNPITTRLGRIADQHTLILPCRWR